MKAFLLALLPVIGLGQGKSQGNPTPFQKVWVCDRRDAQKSPDEGVDNGYLMICSKSATWEAFSNQMYLMFKSKTKGDTLLLHYQSSDVGRGFATFKQWPAANRLFARLYPLSNNQLKVIYLDKAFVRAVRARVNVPDEARKRIFPDRLFLADKHQPRCE